MLWVHTLAPMLRADSLVVQPVLYREVVTLAVKQYSLGVRRVRGAVRQFLVYITTTVPLLISPLFIRPLVFSRCLMRFMKTEVKVANKHTYLVLAFHILVTPGRVIVS